MTDDYDARYYRRREASARDLETKAKDPAIGRIHKLMADKYDALARTADRPTLRIVTEA